MIFALVLAVGLLLAAIAPSLTARFGSRTSAALALYPLSAVAAVLASLPRLGTEVVSWAWVPSLGIRFALWFDGLGALFVFLIGGIGGLVLLYAGAYFGDDERLGRFHASFLLFVTAMLGVVLAGDLFTLFVFWELTGLSSFLLIGFQHDDEKSRRAALQALLVTGAGGLALLAALVLLTQVAGTPRLADILSLGPTLQADPRYLAITLLLVLGAGAKSAQVPLHFWLPGAMAAPTPVSAYLHSATMVKAGFFLLARLAPALGGTPLWEGLLTPLGVATMLFGALVAVPQRDLKRLLAYSTLSTLGLIVALLGVGGTVGVHAAMTVVLAHALYKGALFLVAGIVDHETGSRDVEHLRGLGRKMPWTAAAALLAGLSMAGLPPLFGFLAKETLLETFAHGPQASLLLAAAVITGTCSVTVAARVVWLPFFRSGTPTPGAHDPSWSMRLGPLVLATFGLLAGAVPGFVDRLLLTPAAVAVQGAGPEGHLALWHGWNPLLLVSVATTLLGWILFQLPGPLQGLARAGRRLTPWGPTAAFDRTLYGLPGWAAAFINRLQTGRLRNYVGVSLTVALFAIVASVLQHGEFAPRVGSPSPTLIDLSAAAMVLIGAGVTVTAVSRLVALVGLGVCGYGVALLFALWGGPDLAMTQFSIETLTVLLFMLVLPRLPGMIEPSPRSRRLRDAAFSAVFGGGIAWLVWNNPPPASRLSAFFMERSLPEAHGHNIVNVILVDFRGIDTLGEITVLAIAAAGVFALRRSARRES